MNVVVAEYHGRKLVRKDSFSLNLADFIDEWALYWAIVDACNEKMEAKPC